MVNGKFSDAEMAAINTATTKATTEFVKKN